MKTALFLIPLLLGLASGEEGPKVWVHAPAEDLLSLFPKAGAGYLISIDEYRSLVEKARANEKRLRESPPVGARLASGSVRARVEGDFLRMEAEYVAVSAADGPASVDFPIGRAAVESVEVEGGDWNGESIRFAAPGTYKVRAKLCALLPRVGDARVAEFALPPAAAQTVAVALPPEVEGEVGPIARAFRTDAAGGEVVGYPDSNGLFRLWLQPRARARSVDPLLSASFETFFGLGESRAVARTKLLLEVLRAPMERVRLLVAKGQTVRELNAKGVRSWKLSDGLLDILFVEPVQGPVEISVELEQPRDAAPLVEIPLVRVPDAVRYRGTVGVAAAPETRVNELRAEGARRLDDAGQDRVALFDVWSRDARITATVERVLARTRAVTHALLHLHEGGKSLRFGIFYRVGLQSLYRLEPRLPAGWILRSLTLDGNPVEHAFEKDGRLLLLFPDGLKPGEHLLAGALETDEVDWVSSERGASLDFAGMRSGIDEETGVFAVAGDSSFRVNADSTAGLRAIGMPELESSGFPRSDRILFGWRFEAPGWAARFSLERHRPQISAVVVNRLLPSEQLMQVRAEVALDIQRAGVREVRLALPKGTGRLVEFSGPAIKEKRPPEEGADPETWTIVFQERIRGPLELLVSWERKFEQESWSADFEGVSVPDAQERGFLIVESSPMTALSVDRNGLREADVGELPRAPERPPLEVLAYATHPYRVGIASRRHESREVVQAVALESHVYGVLSGDGLLRCRAEYTVRNNDQPFLSFALPEGATLLAALVDGKPAKPLVEQGRLKLPLPRSRERMEPFRVAIVYDHRAAPLEERGEIAVATPALDIDVLRTGYTLHLPDGYSVVGHEGDLVPLREPERRSLLHGLADLLPSKSEAAAGALAASARDHPLLPTGGAPAPAAKPAAVSGAVPEPAAEQPVADEVERVTEEKRKSDHNEAEDDYDDEVAQADGPTTPQEPPPGGGSVPAKARRPEKALLSLDVEFLKPDNVVRLRSLARRGAVSLRYERSTAGSRARYVGTLLGAALLLLLLFGGIGLRRLLLAMLLLVPALHFAGLSLLPAGTAIGIAQGMGAMLLVALLLRIPRLFRLLLRKRAAQAAGLLLLAATARAQEEVLVPYDPKDPEKIERVFLDSATYQRLRALAFPETAGRATSFLSAEYALRFEKEEATLAVRYEIAKEMPDAERVPLLFHGTAISAATLDGRPATLDIAPDGSYFLVLQGAGRRVLEVTLRPALEGSGGARGVRVAVRPVANARLTLAQDRPGHRSDVVALGRREGDLWHLGPVGTIVAGVAPETAPFEAPAAELRADTEAVAAVRDGFTGFAARIRFGISGGECARFRVKVGKDLLLREVRCADLAGWEVDPEGIVTVALAKPSSTAVVIELFGERPSAREREESFPEVAPLDVLRDVGVLALDTLPDLKLEILDQSGLLRGREEQAPQGLSAAADAGAIHSVYRYALRPFALRWRAALEETRLRAETRIEIRLRPDAARVLATVKVEVERGPGFFSLPLHVPADWEVENVFGETVRDHWREGPMLHLELLRRERKSALFRILLRRQADTTEPLETPCVSVAGAARESGLLVVGAADGYEVDASEASPHLLPEDAARVKARFRVARAWRYVTTPWRVVLRAREEAREIEAMAVTRIVPMEDHLRVEALVNFHVRRGLVDTLQFVVPVTEESAAVVSAPDLRESRSDIDPGGRKFTLTLRTPTRGSASAAIAFDLPYGAPVRCVEPIGASRVRRYVAVEKAPDGEVKVGDLLHLEPGGFDDLPLVPLGTTQQSVARVFVGGDGAVALGVAVQRHLFEEIARAVVHRAAATAVVDRSGLVRTNVSYRVYNRSEQFLRVRLPKGATLYSILVAGEGVRPLAEGDLILVPLRKVAIGMPTFDVDLLYAYEEPRLGDGPLAVRLPEVDRIDVRRTTLSLRLPEEYGYSFETEMEEVEEADLAAGEAADVYQEAKQLYGVVEHGNRWQQERALANAMQLEEEFTRLGEKLQVLHVDAGKSAQFEVQKNAIRLLRESNLSQRQAGEGAEQTVQLVVPDPQKAASVESWAVNDANFKRVAEQEAEQLKDFEDKKQTRARQEADESAGRTVAGTGGGGGGPGKAGENGVEIEAGLFYDDRRDGEYRARLENSFLGRELRDKGAFELAKSPDSSREPSDPEPAPPAPDLPRGDDGAGYLAPPPATAKGRVSIRIDLPKEGKVFHFARLAATGGVTLTAKRSGGKWGPALLSLSLAAAGIFVLFRRRGAG